MSEIFIPVSAHDHGDREQILADLRACGTKRIFLTADVRAFANDARRSKQLSLFRDNVSFYRNEGFEVAIWFSTLGYGTPHSKENREIAKGYTPIRSILGKTVEDALCPTSDAFCAMMVEFVTQVAECRPSMMMLDDELCLSVRPGLGCACERHLQLFSERVGEKITLDGLPQRLFSGKKNCYRSAWLALQGDTLKEFCAKLRRAVDAVDPTIRMGFAAGYTSWDVEGVDAIELTRVLAGNTRPFLRLTGAPYWVGYGRFGRQTLATVVEMARMQAAWVRNTDVEFFTEIDSYPRSRFFTPRAYTEAFDLATRTSDDLNHLKYMYEYTCPVSYERGYVDEHLRNLPLYSEIAAIFGKKKSIGIRVYEEMHKLENADLGNFPTGDYASTHAHEKKLMAQYAFSNAQKLLTPHAIPTVYEGEGLCGIAFGENAKYLPKEALSHGLILDIKAAGILQNAGIDVGLCSAERMAPLGGEEFLDGAAPLSQQYDAGPCYRIECKEGAKVLSQMKPSDFSDGSAAPFAYLYENEQGQRFLVYAFDAEEQAESSAVYWTYGRGVQIANALPWLSGKELPARCHRHPHLYAIAKEGNGKLALAYLNLHPDAVYNAEIKLDRDARSVRFLNCCGERIDARTLCIHHISAYGFAGVEIE